MNSLYQNVPIQKIKSWAKDLNEGGEPDVYKQLVFHLDSAASANFKLHLPVNFIKGLRIEEVHVYAAQPVPVVYVQSSTLNNVLSYNSFICPKWGVDVNNADVSVEAPTSYNTVGVVSTQWAANSSAHFNSYTNSCPEFLPCRGNGVIDSIDLRFTTGVTDVSNVTAIFLKLGVMCRDQNRA